jgi:hypothetical protein
MQKKPLKTQSINLFNLARWARQTARSDKANYQLKTRPVDAVRLASLLIPNLEKPIFIIGSPRSGTTFLGACIGVLPEISYHFEPVATQAASRYVYEGEWSMAKAKLFYRSVYAWLMRLHLDADLRFAEKTPRNCFIVDFLSKAFPISQFIHIIRDGRDAALSHSKKPWLQASQASSGKADPSGYPYGPYPRFWVERDREDEYYHTTDIHRCIWTWRRHTEAALQAGSKLPARQYHELRYESLVSNATEEAERLLEFLEISEPSSRRLFHQEIAKAKTDSIGNWKGRFSDSQLEQINKEAGKLLAQLGYDN